MFTRNTRSIFLALALTFLLAGLSWNNAHAQDPTPPPSSTSTNACRECHADIYDGWFGGGHSGSHTGEVFGQSSNCVACHSTNIPSASAMPSPGASDFPAIQGQPPTCAMCHTTGYDAATGTWKADGITCEACHSPIPPEHPDKQVEISTMNICQKCHTSDRFDWRSWQSSTHYQDGMVCTVCHNPHTTSLKLRPDEKDLSSLCQNCHPNQAQNAQHSAHTKTGVTCIGCHLGDPTGPDEFHKIPNHDFKPDLSICMKCHSDEMHTGAPSLTPDVPELTEEPTPTPIATVAPVAQTTDTAPRSSPMQIIGMTALAGLAGGIVIGAIRKKK